MTRHRIETEPAPEYAGAAYRCRARWARGVAWRVVGWQIEPVSEAGAERIARDLNPEGDGVDADGDPFWYPPDPWPRERTGRVVAIMIGDDQRFALEPGDLEPIDDHEWCDGCGQIGCGHGSARDDGPEVAA